MVVHPESNQGDDRERHGVAVRAAPDGGAHRDDVILAEKDAVSLAREVLAQRHPLERRGVLGFEHLGRALAEAEHLANHVEKRGADGVAGLCENSAEAEGTPLDVVGGEREGHVGALRRDAQLVEETDEMRVRREIEHLCGSEG